MFLFIVFILLLYGLSIIGTAVYFSKECYDFKLIYFIAAIMPFWNTYLAYKCITADHGSFWKAIKYHFTWGK